ncbi:MAG: T9SS type A sorting domain-containing protein [Sphingobacteriales bacterium]|nr:MAG: T9SS type A sorting domain-containing protein [Sphingobacteriales bacterium]
MERPGGYSATGNVLSIPNSTPAMSGVYVVTVTNAGGCTASNSRNITVYPLPNAVITGNTNICVGSTLILSASGGTSYVWSGPGFSSTSANISRANATVAMSGTYTVTVTGTGGCKSTASVLVTVNAKPVITITGATSVCSGTTITFTATGGVSYAWSGPGGFTDTGATMERPGATTAMAGVYKVTVTNAAGCTNTASKSVTVLASPNAVITGMSSVCVGANLSQSASGGTSYLWSFPDGPTANTAAFVRIGATLPMGGTYTVTVTASNGCKSTASKVIAVSACKSDLTGEEMVQELTAYPNPTGGLTTIAFTSVEAEHVSLSVFNTEGKEVATLFNGQTESLTNYEFELDLSLLAPGLYYAVLHPANGQIQRIKLIVTR